MITSARLPTTKIVVSIGTMGAPPKIGEILPLCDFFDFPAPSLPFFSILHRGRTAGPVFTLYGSNDVFAHRTVLLGWEQWVTIFGENVPPKSPKMGVNRQFQAKTEKYKNRSISRYINRIKTKFEDQAETSNYTLCNITYIKSNMAAGRRLEK